MVRSRIGSPPSEATIAPHGGGDDEASTGALRERLVRAWSCGALDRLRDAAVRLADALTDTVRPWVPDRARSVALGCLLALGGCSGEGPRVDIDGVVLDGRTGAPISGARVSSDDGSIAETDVDGRFELSVEGGERELTARADGHEAARRRVRAVSGARVEMRISPRVPRPVDAAGTPAHEVPTFDGNDDAALRVASCAGCHASRGLVAQWTRSGMSGVDPTSDAPARRAECARCHEGRSFVAWRTGGAARRDAPVDDALPITCGTCHEAHADDAFGLRVDDRSAPIAGARVPHLGSGALCTTCHRADASDAADASPHAPQSEVLVGRGARLVAASDDGSHRHIADTCARCHMAPPVEGQPAPTSGAHTFTVRRADGRSIASRACAPCHGDVDPDAIGARDWDGDAIVGGWSSEHARAMDRINPRWHARVEGLAVRDRCAGSLTATDVVEHDARLHLVDAEGRLLGDCDGDGRIGSGERAVTTRALPDDLADVAYDLTLVRADGSRGAHNPAFTFAVLDAIEAALR
ncbi:MAG TPA: carboxypeptidase-like regulatory domain-containing protein [Sandaracinaceae bacterium LLY-WYZ-13_1]|nr:carboxypeptidase-like regulatory domain-containing protein [Sandaracinaceae bacterium LLY-WYZ-13_1]